MTLVVVEYVEAADGQVRVGGKCLEDARPALGDVLHRLGVEEVRRTDQCAAEPSRTPLDVELLVHRQVQVEPGHRRTARGLVGVTAGAGSGEVEGGAVGVLQGQHDLEEGVAGQ
ncbi:hypothetical protein GCM10022403_005870 [Streptomyces coacervatus]|uniref:Uncharacterized protein n=1 Tax=Streptomyces coacervatus TaxID=647381 RepID=A0ABP7GVQ1_9ACTN